MPPALSLLPHQEEAASRILSDHKALLALPAGAGKTLIVLESMRRLLSRPGASCGSTLNVLVIAPAPLVGVWRDEWAKWAGILPPLDSCVPPLVYRGTPKERARLALELPLKEVQRRGQSADMDSSRGEGGRMVVVSYELVRQEIDLFTSCAWDMIVLDESGKIRNPTAKLTKAILKLQADYQVALDGNPVSNTIADLWAPCTWLEKQVYFGNWWKFRGYYALMNPYIPGKIDGWRNVEEIKNRSAHLIMWRKKEEILPDLPSKREEVIAVELSPEERAVYKRIKKEMVLELRGEDIPLQNALVKLLRLRQATYGKILFEEGSGSSCSKFEAGVELIHTFEPGSKVVVFTQFEVAARLFAERLKEEGIRVSLITGGTGPEEREKIVREFHETKTDVEVLVGTSAIERGLNLQVAEYMIHLDLPWSFASYDQRIGRIWRQGQKKPVLIYSLEAEGTVDGYMKTILEKKIEIADEVRAVSREDVDRILDIEPF